MNAHNSKPLVASQGVLTWMVVLGSWLTCPPLFAESFANYGRIVFPEGVINGAATWTWAERASMPWPRTGFAACSVNGKIYVFGGYTFSPYVPSFKTVAEYDPATDAWTTKADMPTTRTWVSCSPLNGKIYVIGGMQGPVEQGNPGLPTVEEYDPATDTWTRKANMLTGRAVSGTCVAEGKIYAIGGVTTFAQPLTAVEAYDPATDRWSASQDLPAPGGAVAAVQVNGHIYATGRGTPAGGFDSRMDRYDPLSDTWVRLADMPTARGFLTTAALKGRVYTFGGLNGNPSAAVEVYNPFADSWFVRGDMNLPNVQGGTQPFRSFGLASAVIGDTIYVMGGARSNLSGDSNIVLAYAAPTTDILFDEGPLSVAYGLPSATHSPLPGWDENAITTISNSGMESPACINAATLVATLPFDDTFTHIAHDDAGNELGRVVMRAQGRHKIDLSADRAIVDEMTGTIQLAFGGNLIGNGPAAALSVIDATGIYASATQISADGLALYVSGYVLLPLESDPDTCLCLQDNILRTFATGQIIDTDVHSLWEGEYQAGRGR